MFEHQSKNATNKELRKKENAMTVETKASITLAAEDHASPVIRNVLSEINKLSKAISNLGKLKTPNLQISSQSTAAAKATAAATIKSDGDAMAALRRRFAFEGRMARQAARERADDAKAGEQDRRAFESRAMRDLREKMAFTGRMTRQRLADERTVAREQQRAADQADRAAASLLQRRIASDRQRIALRTRMERQEATAHDRTKREAWGHAKDAGRRGRDAYWDLTRPSAAAAAAVGAVTIGAGRSSFASRMDVEAAETNLRMFGSELARPGKAAKLLSAADVAVIREGWLNEAAIGSGVSPLAGITAYTEVLKAGIDLSKSRAMTELLLTASAGMDMSTTETTRVMGRMSTVMGGVTAPRMRDIMNSMAIAAGETAADPNEIVSGMDRGMGSLAYGMSPEDLAAWVAVGRSTGIQAGKTGNFISTLLQNGIGAKNQRGQKLEDMNKAARMVGMGSAQGMSRAAAADPSSFLEQMFGRIEAMTIGHRAQFSRLMGGQEWDDEILQMKQGLGKLKEVRAAIKDERNSNFLEDNRDLKNASLAGLWARSKSRIALLWETFGDGFSNTFSEVATYFITSGRAINLAGLRSVGQSFMTGIVNGLNFRSWTGFLERAFGKAGGLDWGVINDRIYRFAKGFGEGVRAVADSVMTVVRTFTGGDASAETIGKLTAKILGFASALVIAAPAVTILSGIATGILAIGSAAAAAYAAFKVAGLAGSGTGVAGLLSAATLTTAGGVIAAAFLAKIAEAYSILKPPSLDKGLGRGLLEFLDPRLPGLADRLFDGKPAETDAPAKVERQSSSSDWRGMIQPASLRRNDELVDGIERLDRSFNALGARIHLASLGGPAASAVASFGGGSTPGLGGGGGGGGGGVDPAHRFGKSFFTPGQSAPSWFGRGSGGGSASSNPANSAASAALLDAIAGTESGKAGYDAVLGNGRYGTPSKPVSTMSIDEAFAFGRQVRARHGSSSALGRYQIVGATMRSAQKALGIDGNATFDPAMQDRMARWIARNQGLGAWEGLKGNPRAMAAARAAMQQGGAQDAPTASPAGPLGTGPQVAGGFHPLDGKGRFTSDFGMRKHPLNGMFKMHRGIDLAASAGTAVKAMKDGIVSVGRQGDVTIKHPDGTSTVYRHISPKVGNGENVTGGQAIGAIAPTDGRSTGPHLHLEHLDDNGRPQDPKALLSKVPVGIAGQGNTPEALVKGVPLPPARPGGVGGPPGLDQGGTGFKSQGGGNGGGVVIHQVIHGAGENPNELAGKIQRHITEAWNYRASDMEADLA